MVLANEEAIDGRVITALNFLIKRSFGYKLAMSIADITGAIEIQSKKYNGAAANLFQAHGAKKTHNGFSFDEFTGDPIADAGKIPMPEECDNELKKLLKETMEHNIDQIELPTKRMVDGKEVEIEYEPMIFIGLRKFIKK